MPVNLVYYPVKGGKAVRMHYRINGQRYTEKIDIRLYNKDPDMIKKKQIIEATRAKKELELATNRHNVDVLFKSDTLPNFLATFIATSDLAGIKKYRNLAKYVNKFFKGRVIDTISYPELSKFLEMMYTKVAIQTANSYFSGLSRIFREAEAQGLCRSNPCAKVRKRSGGNKSIKDVLFIDEFRHLLTFPLAERKNGLKQAAILSFYTGIGYKECKLLKWSQIRNNELRYKRGKNENEISIPMKESVLQVLGPPGNGLVFPRLPHESQARKTLLRWCERAGIEKHITFYCFRHSFAVNLLLHGADIKTVADLLGHTSLKHTVKYLNYVDSLKRKSVINLPDL